MLKKKNKKNPRFSTLCTSLKLCCCATAGRGMDFHIKQALVAEAVSENATTQREKSSVQHTEKNMDTKRKTLSDYQDEYITLLTMARCSSRYLRSIERGKLGAEQVTKESILEIWELYRQYSERLKEECLKTTGLPLECMSASTKGGT